MRGESVVFEYPVASGEDALGSAVYTWGGAVTVDNVLCAPSETSDDRGSTRPMGDESVWTLYVPKSASPALGSLRNCRVMVRGEWFLVKGDPRRWEPCPTDWDMRVEAVRTDG